MREIEIFAREGFANSNSGESLGPLISVRKQLVAGMNYKMTFASASGNVEIVVFDQPWTNTREIISLETSETNKVE